jgi:S-formylglutathione hydrolase FrmB
MLILFGFTEKRMSFCEIHWFSKVLGRQTTTWLLLPDTGTPPFDTFYLLHGLSDDHTMWLRRTRLEMYVADLPLIVVMPDGGRGFYTNHEAGPRWADHIAMELPEFIERNFAAKSTRDARHIGGLSMGGYGALRLSLGFPDRFSSATSHSGALMNGGKHYDIPERTLVFGQNPAGTDHDLTHLAARAKANNRLPRIQIDCGTDDFLLQDNRALHQNFEQQQIPHTYTEYPGSHTWDYWDKHIREAIAFHTQNLTRADPGR